jgi:hypothetical protein
MVRFINFYVGKKCSVRVEGDLRATRTLTIVDIVSLLPEQE